MVVKPIVPTLSYDVDDYKLHQWHQFPANLDFDNPLSEIQRDTTGGYAEFNLRLKNGVNSDFEFPDETHNKEKYLKFLPEDGEVPLETIEVSYNMYNHEIQGFRFLDRKGALILETFLFGCDDECEEKVIKLGEGERWVGF